MSKHGYSSFSTFESVNHPMLKKNLWLNSLGQLASSIKAIVSIGRLIKVNLVDSLYDLILKNYATGSNFFSLRPNFNRNF